MISRAVLFFLCALAAYGNRVLAADLLEVFQQAKSADATYAAARAAWSATQERIPQARAGLLPLATVNASAQQNDRDTRFRDSLSPRADSRFSSTGATLSITQPLYRAQNAVVYRQALTQVDQADAQLALAAQELILRMAQAYFDVLLGEDTVVLAQSQTASIGQQLEQAKRNFAVGTVAITDTHEAQARFDLSRAQEIAALNDLELRKRVLEQIIGRSAPPLSPLGASFTLTPAEPASIDTWVELARSRNLQVRIAQDAWQFSTQEIARNRAGHLPTLDAFVTLSSTGAGAGTTGINGVAIAGGPGTDTRSAVAGVQLAIPLYQGGLVSSRVREAIANESRALYDLENARRGAVLAAQQGFLGIMSSIAQARALEAAVISTQSQLDSTQLGRDVGVRTQVDVLNANQLLFTARRDLAQARYAYVLSMLRLEAAVGALTEDDLATVNRWLGARSPTSLAAVSASTTIPQDVPKPRIDGASLPAAGAGGDATAAVREAIENWARAWSSNDVGAYLGHYAPEFEPARGLTRAAWEAERSARIRKPRRIEVTIETAAVTFDADRANVTFRQSYRSGALNVTSEKSLVLVKAGERWLIQRETVLSERLR